MKRFLFTIFFLASSFYIFSQIENTSLYKLLFDGKSDTSKVELSEIERYNIESKLLDFQMASNKNEYSNAVSHLQYILETDSTCSVCLFRAAKLVFNNEPDISIAYFLQALRFDAENPEYISYLISYLHHYEKYDLFIDVLEYAAYLETDNPFYGESLFNEYLNSHKYKKAYNTLQLIESKFGKSLHTTLLRADLYNQIGKQKHSIKILKKEIKDNPTNPQLYSTIAFTYYKYLSKYNKAKHYAAKALEFDNNFYEAQLTLFMVAKAEKDDESLFYIIKDILSNSTFPLQDKKTYLNYLPPNYNSLYSLDDTFDFLLNLVKIDDSNSHLVGIYLDINENRLSNESVNKLLTEVLEYTDNSFLWIDYLTKYNNLFKFDNSDIHNISELFPTHGLINYAISLYYYINEDFKIALRHALIAEDNVDDFVSEAHYSGVFNLLADIYVKLDRYDDAFKAYDILLILNNEDIAAMNNYAYYLSLKKHNLSRAESMISTVIKKEPHNPIYLDTYAWVMFAQGLYADALFIFEQIDIESQNKSIYFEHYADILYFNDEIDKAVYYWNKALDIFDNEDYEDNTILKKKIEHRKYYENNKY